MLVLFDIDDTLLDDAAATREAVDALREHLGLDVPVFEFRSRWSDSLRHHFARYIAGEIDFHEQRRARVREVLGSDVSDVESDRIFQVYLDVYESRWSLFADVLPCLDALSKHRLGIVSNGNAQQQLQKLSRLGIVDRFSCLVMSEECGFAKPDPRIFARACELGNTPPSNAVHVGDRLDIDAIAAARAGLGAVWLDRHGTSHDESLRPGMARLTTLSELPMLVN